MFKTSMLLLAAAPIFAQLPSNTLTISATRSIAPQPDEAVFALTVSSGTGATLGQIVAALSSAGITSSNLSGVDNSTATTLQWSFTFAAPLANLAAAINSFANLQQTIGQNNSGLTLGFSVVGTQAGLLEQRIDRRCDRSGAEDRVRGGNELRTDSQIVDRGSHAAGPRG